MRNKKQKTRSRNLSMIHNSNSALRNDKGIALVMALVISLVVMLTITGVLYFIIQSTTMSGAGKRYATAAEAADGAVEVMKDAINLMMVGDSIAALPIVDGPPPCLVNAILSENQICTTTITLPGTVSGFTATVVVERLYSSTLVGGRIEFARGGGAPTTGVFYRINTTVAGPAGTSAETTALYRLTM